MSERAAGGLGAALRDRLVDRVRMIERAQALETHPAGARLASQQVSDAEALLRQCLRALGDRDGYLAAGRVLAGETPGPESVTEWTALQDLAQAGLVSWDLGTGAAGATPLLRELYGFLAAAVAEAAEA